MRAMPTGGKLAAAVCFAIVGWIAADLYEPAIDEALQAFMAKRKEEIEPEY